MSSVLDLRAGYFQVRIVRGGAWIPAEIRHIDTMWELEIIGRGIIWRGDEAKFRAEMDDAITHGHAMQHPVSRVLLWGRAIEEPEFAYQRARRLWAIEHAPETPEAQAGVPIDFDTLPPPSF